MIAILEELLDQAELKRRGFTSLVALTYGIDLPWFERHVGRQLRIAGVRRLAIFADARALDQSLAADAGELDGAGTWYSISAMHVSGAFHPKAILLTGTEAARLYVGSGNLNPSGLGRNLELYERWDASAGEGAIDRVFEDFRKYIDRLLVHQKTPLPHVDDVLREAFGQPVLSQPRREGSARVFGGLPDKLIDQVATAATPANELVMTAPFFDSEGELAVAIARRLGATKFDVLVDPGMTNLTEQARAAIQAAGGVFRAYADESRPRRCVHAKALFAAGDGWLLGIHGSANLSNAAWRGHNAELIVVRRNEAAKSLRTLVGSRPVREIDEEEWKQLHECASSDEVAFDCELSLVIRAASWVNDTTIELVTPDVTADIVATLVCRLADRTLRVSAIPGVTGVRTALFEAAELRGRSIVVRLESEGAAGPWTVVHDRAVLRSHARDRSPFDDDAGEYFDGARTADSTEALLELLSAIADERTSGRDAQARTAGPKVKNGGDQDWVWVTLADFDETAPPTSAASDPAPAQPDGRPDPGKLLVRLLLGDPEQQRERLSNGIQDPDEERPAGSPAPQDTKPEKPPRDLTRLVERTQVLYLQRLSRRENVPPPSRLLHELVILLATFQDAARHGSITDRQLANGLAAMTGALLGAGDAPLPRSLGQVSTAAREELWARTPLLGAAALAIYNACLVNAVVMDETPSDATFSDLRAVLWLRNVVRHAPGSDASVLAMQVERDLPWLRRFSVLWIADRWPFWDSRFPFEDFVRSGLRTAFEVERIDGILRAAPSPKYRLEVDEDADVVVGLGRDQRLAVGFRDSVPHKSVHSILFDGALQRPDAIDLRRRPLEARNDRVRSLTQVSDVLDAAGMSNEERDAAVALLRRLAG